jgi:MscS family membrane protein
VLLAAFIATRLLARLLRVVLVRIARRTTNAWDDRLATALGSPLSALLAIWALALALPWLPIEPHVAAILRDSIGVGSVIAVLWAVFRGIDLVRAALELRPWAIQRPASRSLLRLGARFGKVTALVLGVLVALGQLGVSVASLIAGLGIGGLVLALAAQKTVENLFGTVSIGVDQPMREGDFVRIGECLGTVEQIGLRSTRIRTLDRTLVTIPNGELATQRVESFTARDRIRLACTIGLVYDTTSSQLRAIVAALEAVLRAHPKIWQDNVVVRFARFSDSSLDLEIMAWFQTCDWSEFQTIRQDVLIAFLEAVERAGSSIAFPTRTVHVIGEASSQRPPAGQT